ncbi:cytochrome c1 heme lyase [Schizosaccharomyces cryophilus OY26]|uniref:Holocytochrome c-type synthase n=1 Tax=Schizosaccharomyces cryophilus (strain OY26 / ATCC MYA-4695 / CBS 11777 / NBRC 106824 / NRRL Y48691) TaxID=653667 RepID=S9X8B4_SCHCR|nr:cytochrome c1 heme lyase [Schizosaccharomyces cryophilus OY26]EPY53327.1 cytochrome c1 heme lyase [Schizosaccharomyces cryophilus OY26]
MTETQEDSQETQCPVSPEVREAWLKSQSNKNRSQPNASASPVELPTDREISGIPKLLTDPNSEKEEKWIYPSQKMFFEAMQRKNWNPNASDMKTIVPIHNAVNEKAWQEILDWEKGWGSESCGGPKLEKFQGDVKKLTPKARILGLLGYNKPFDRHDWLVDRCGKKVCYVIDFYNGRSVQGVPSMYLDVRPKLTAHGAWMRLYRWSSQAIFQGKTDQQ